MGVKECDAHATTELATHDMRAAWPPSLQLTRLVRSWPMLLCGSMFHSSGPWVGLALSTLLFCTGQNTFSL
jgi:hypothetical protein